MKVLFVEDEENATVGVNALLESKDHEVDVAGTCGEAVERLRQETYDLVILDVMMEPGPAFPRVAVREAGKELLLRLRSGDIEALKTSKDVPVVAMTAVSDIGVRVALESAKNVCVLLKPIDPEDVILNIDRFISGEKSGEF